MSDKATKSEVLKASPAKVVSTLQITVNMIRSVRAYKMIFAVLDRRLIQR